MRGLDTNVLVRLFTEDDPSQHALARSFVESCEDTDQELHVSAVVLCELVWTLAGTRYRSTREMQAQVVEELLETAIFVVEDHDLAKIALEDFRAGRGDLADYLIGRVNARAGSTDTVTFDRSLEAEKGFTVLEWPVYPPDAAPPSLLNEP